jgi:hypothetical protein
MMAKRPRFAISHGKSDFVETIEFVSYVGLAFVDEVPFPNPSLRGLS